MVVRRGLVVPSVMMAMFALALVSMQIASARGTVGVRFGGAGEKAKIGIVIDDFGQDRSGVEAMLGLGCRLTVAVMPFMEHTRADAEAANGLGHEVIVHMPMQARKGDPASWYGPGAIRLGDARETAYEKTIAAIEDVPYAVGLNPHVGSGCTEDREIMMGVMQACREKGLYFFDSLTSMKSVAREAAREVGVRYARRDEFLEHEARTAEHAAKKLRRALAVALRRGDALVIGHVGPEGGKTTVAGIRGVLAEIEEKGAVVVGVSEIVGLPRGEGAERGS